MLSGTAYFEFFLAGTFPPLRRACERPIAIACFLLFTILPEEPDLSFPRFISCIALLTFCDALLPYFFLDDALEGIVHYFFAIAANPSRANWSLVHLKCSSSSGSTSATEV
jgi:hypothetical protein